jgi:hypothetical protein
LFAFFGFESQMGTAAPLAPDRADVLLEHAVTARISQRPDLAQGADGCEVFFDNQFLDDRLEGIQLRSARRAFPGTLLNTTDGFDIDGQLPRNLLVRMPLGQQRENLLVALSTLLGL